MTREELENKIEELKCWLQHNQNHVDYSTVLRDKIHFENELLNYG